MVKYRNKIYSSNVVYITKSPLTKPGDEFEAWINQGKKNLYLIL